MSMENSRITRFKKDFNLNGITEVYFWKSEWERYDPHDHDTPVSLYYFAYRFFYMAWFVGTYTQNFLCHKDDDNNFYTLYLTNQTFTLQVAYAVLYFLYICWAFWRKRKHSKVSISEKPTYKSETGQPSQWDSFHDDNYQLPIVCKVLWITINILNVVPYVVTAIYWLVLFGSHENMRTCEILVNLFTHALNSPFVLLDAFVVAVPIRRTHAIFPFLFAVYYTLFSGLYEVFNGRYDAANEKEYIYPILNWKNQPQFAIITCVGAYIATFVVHFILSWGVYRLRIFLKTKCSKLSDEAM